MLQRAPRATSTTMEDRLDVLQARRAATEPTRSMLRRQLAEISQTSSSTTQAHALSLRGSLLEVNTQLAGIMKELNTLEWQSMIIDKEQFIMQEKQLSDLYEEINRSEREIEESKYLLRSIETRQTRKDMPKLFTECGRMEPVQELLMPIASSQGSKTNTILEADQRMEAAEALVMLRMLTPSVNTYPYQCGLSCSQNVAYNQPFLPSLAMGTSRVVPECLLHRPDIPFIQNAFTEDIIRNNAAINLWTLHRGTGINSEGCSTNRTLRAGSVGSSESGSTIIDEISRYSPQSPAVRYVENAPSAMLSDSQAKKIMLPSMSDLLSGKAKAKAKAKVEGAQARKRTKTAKQMKSKSQASLPSPPLSLSPPSNRGLVSPETPTFNRDRINGAGVDQFDHINPHLNFGLGHDPNHRPTIGLDTANIRSNRRTNGSNNSSGIPVRAPVSASSAGIRAQKPASKGVRKSTRNRTPSKRNGI